MSARRVNLNDFRGHIPQTQRPAAATGGMAPPPLPPRRQATMTAAGSLYGSPFGGSYVSPYGGDVYGSSYNLPYSYRTPYASRYGYGSYGAGGYGVGGYGAGGYGGEDPYSPFQSVESIVRAISSLSMMVESTYQSMYMSFRAVLGVADNMEQLRRVVFDLFGSLTLVKTVIWFCKKVLYVLGLLKNNPVREKAWEAAAAEVVGGPAAGSSSRRTWPLVVFFGLMLGGPYVLYKLAVPTMSPAGWDPKTEGAIKCIAIHDFETDQKGELPFRRGEVLLRRRNSQGGWVLAAKKDGRVGYVPADRLKPVNQITPTLQQKPFAQSADRQMGYMPSYGQGIIPPSDSDVDSDIPFPPIAAQPTYYAGTPKVVAPPVATDPVAPASPVANHSMDTVPPVTVDSDTPTAKAQAAAPSNQPPLPADAPSTE